MRVIFNFPLSRKTLRVDATSLLSIFDRRIDFQLVCDILFHMLSYLLHRIQPLLARRNPSFVFYSAFRLLSHLFVRCFGIHVSQISLRTKCMGKVESVNVD